jgi:Na+/H+ antiporter NhaA
MIVCGVNYSMPIPCKLPILKNISYLSGIMFTFSIFIPLISETTSTIDTNSLTILSITGMIISFGIGMKIRKKIAKKSKRLY